MKRFFKLAAFLLLLTSAYCSIDSVFRFKYWDSEQLSYFYRHKKQDIDVLFVGSSHVICDINPVTIWNEYGVPSYDLAGGFGQPLWNSYFYIKEGLKYQKTKLIVLEVGVSAWGGDFEYGSWASIVRNTIDFKPSKLKWESIKVSSPDKRLDLFIGFPVYHTRYNELSKRDFFDPYDGGKIYKNGYSDALMGLVTPLPRPDITDMKTKEPLSRKKMEYLLKIIELTEKENIKLLLIVSPYASMSAVEEQKCFNFIADIAEEHNLRFINYNLLYDELGLDFQTDFAEGSHLNPSGAEKLSRHLGAVLLEEYGFPNRRGEPAYADWNVWGKKLKGK